MSRVQSIERAFAVLGALTDGPAGVTDVAGRVGLPKSTAARMLESLQREGAVEQVPGETRYRLGPRIVTLSAGLRDTRGLVAIAHPTLVALAKRVTATVDASIREEQVQASITLRDGRTVRKRIEHAVGSLERPMSDADLDAKFLGLSRDVMPEAQARRTIELCRRIDALPSAGDVAAAARRG